MKKLFVSVFVSCVFSLGAFAADNIIYLPIKDAIDIAKAKGIIDDDITFKF